MGMWAKEIFWDNSFQQKTNNAKPYILCFSKDYERALFLSANLVQMLKSRRLLART